MKIIHLSDIHIHSEPILEHNPIERFGLALDHIKNNHVDADMLIITGDITHQGDVASYKKFDEIYDKEEITNLFSVYQDLNINFIESYNFLSYKILTFGA